MVKTWRDSEEEVQRKGSVMEAGLAGIEAMEGAVSTGYENVPLRELRKESPSKFVKTQQRWCKNWIAESNSHANINKEKLKKSFTVLLDFINKNCKGRPFNVQDVLNWIDARRELTDGNLQRKILSWMVCLGILEMRHEIVKKRGKNKPRYVFVKLDEVKPCSYLCSGECKFNWKSGAVTDYFPPEYKSPSDNFEENKQDS